MSTTNVVSFLDELEKDSVKITEQLLTVIQNQKQRIYRDNVAISYLEERTEEVTKKSQELKQMKHVQNAKANISRMQTELDELKKKAAQMEEELARKNDNLRKKYDNLKRKYATAKETNDYLMYEEPRAKRQRRTSSPKPHPAEGSSRRNKHESHSVAEQKHSDSDSSTSDSSVSSTSSHEPAVTQLTTVQKNATNKLTIFVCNIDNCKKVFTDAGKLESHARSHETSTDQREDKRRNHAEPKKSSSSRKTQSNGRNPKINKP